MDKKSIINNVVTAVITALIIAAATWILSWSTSGGLIRELKGITQNDFKALEDDAKKIYQEVSDSIKKLESKIDQEVSDSIKKLENKIDQESRTLYAKLEAIGAIRYEYANLMFYQREPGDPASDVKGKAKVEINADGKGSYNWKPQISDLKQIDYAIVCSWPEMVEWSGISEDEIIVTTEPSYQEIKVEFELKEKKDGWVRLKINYLIAIPEKFKS